jgi:hypothetical protein
VAVAARVPRFLYFLGTVPPKKAARAARVQEALRMSRFAPEVYRSDGGFSAGGLPILLLSMWGAALALGWLASFIGQWFYLILLFPLGIGLGLVGVGVIVGRLTKMRSPALAALVGLISGIVAIVSMHYFNYQRNYHDPDRQKLLSWAPVLENLPAGVREPKVAEAQAALKQAREAESFLGYLNLEATLGVTISHRGQGGFNIGYTGTWIYWGLELFGVAVMATLGLMGGAMAPFCSTCNEWKEERPLGMLSRQGVDVPALLSSGELDALKAHCSAVVGTDLLLSVSACGSCRGNSPIAVKLEELSKNDKGELVKNEVVHLTYPGEALAEFEAMFVSKPEPKQEAT